MSLVGHYLPYFSQWLITSLLTAFLPFQPFVYWSLCRDQLLAPLPFSGAPSEFLPPLLCASFQFIVYSVFFCGGGGFSLPKGLSWFIPGVSGGIPCDAWHPPVWSAECLLSKFGAGVSWRQEPSYFLSVTWHGEAFYGLVVQGVKIVILLGALFPPSVAPASQQDFCFTGLTLSASVP
jgi:hypothetical protein